MRPTRDELKLLMLPREGPHASLYLPTHRRGPEIRQDPIRLKNLLREARGRLAGIDLPSADVTRLLEPAEALVDDGSFWRHRDGALALFLAHGFFRHFDLPEPCDELVVVTRRFHLKPMLPLFFDSAQFFVLALNLGATRVLRCDSGGAHEIDVAGMPRSLDDTLKYDEGEPQLQFHTTGAPRAGGAGRAAVFHGQGGAADETRSQHLRFCQQIDATLHRRIADSNAPLVVAGLGHLQAIYREANRYPHLMPDGIDGNPDGMEARELHRRAAAIVRPRIERPRDEAADRLRGLLASGSDRAAAGLNVIVPAAIHGRVDTLFVAVGVQRWGRHDPARDTIELRAEPAPSDEDLLDLAATHTIVNGGAVYAVAPADVPSAEGAAALLRF